MIHVSVATGPALYLKKKGVNAPHPGKSLVGLDLLRTLDNTTSMSLSALWFEGATDNVLRPIHCEQNVQEDNFLGNTNSQHHE